MEFLLQNVPIIPHKIVVQVGLLCDQGYSQGAWAESSLDVGNNQAKITKGKIRTNVNLVSLEIT